MIILENNTNSEINLDLLEDISKYLEIKRDVELLIVDNATIQSINKEHRGKDAPTDVLSFPLENIEFAPLGSIVISIDKAKEISAKLGHSLDDEIALLFTHGILHLLGYDHEIDDGQMRAKEAEVVNKFNLPQSLIVRVGEE